MPELLTVVRVIPEGNEMSEDEEVERIGMEIAMEYERMAENRRMYLPRTSDLTSDQGMAVR